MADAFLFRARQPLFPGGPRRPAARKVGQSDRENAAGCGAAAPRFAALARSAQVLDAARYLRHVYAGARSPAAIFSGEADSGGRRFHGHSPQPGRGDRRDRYADMKQIAQSQRGGELRVVDVPVPALRPEGVLVRTAYSVISAGTERAKVDLAKKSLLGKALARPDQVRQVVRMARSAGIQATVQKVMNRLDALNPLGYSSAGIVVGVGDQVRDLAVGDRVACAGAGYANHA